MNKAIVSGANGFIGSALVRELAARGIEVIALDKEGHAGSLQEHSLVKFYSFDLANAEDAVCVIKERDADTFYHCAWAGASRLAKMDTVLQLQNAQWAVDCLLLAQELGCRRFVNVESIAEKAIAGALFSQGNTLGLEHIYGSGKLAAHAMCKAAASNIGIDLVGAIIPEVYGAGEEGSGMINTIIKKCIAGESSQFDSGTWNCDFVYIDDVARALRLIGEKGKASCEYYIGSSDAKMMKEFLLELKGAVAPEVDFVFKDTPFSGLSQPLEDFDCSLLEKDTGFRAEISFGEGCRRIRDWWIQIMKGN